MKNSFFLESRGQHVEIGGKTSNNMAMTSDKYVVESDSVLTS